MASPLVVATHLNGRCGTIAGGEAEPAWNGERYKVDVRTDEATTSRVLVRPRNLPGQLTIRIIAARAEAKGAIRRRFGRG